MTKQPDEFPEQEIFWVNGSWYFWDADWTSPIGPFDTEQECQENYKEYNRFMFTDDEEKEDEG